MEKILSFTVKISFYEPIEMKEDVVEIGKRIGIALTNHINNSEIGLCGDSDNFTTSIQIDSDNLCENITTFCV